MPVRQGAGGEDGVSDEAKRISEREFWLAVRAALIAIVRAIERRYLAA